MLPAIGLPDCNIKFACPDEIAKSAASSAVDGVATAMADALGRVIKALFTFWTKAPNPDLEAPGGVVAQVRDATWWITCAIAVACLLIAAGRMALTRSSRPAGETAKGFLTLVVVSSVSVAAVAAAMRGTDALSTYILDAADTQTLGTKVAVLATGMHATLGPGLAIVVGLIAVCVSLVQMTLLIIRGGVLVVLVGILPLTAAAAVTPAGSVWLKKTVAWIVAFLLFKPAAAIAYTTALLLITDGKDAVDVLRGLALICLSVLALPALLRTITPAVGAMTGGGGGGAALAGGGVAALATGARMVATRSKGAERSGPPSGTASGSGPRGAAQNGRRTLPAGGGAGQAAGGAAAKGAAGGAASSAASGGAAAGAGAAGGPVGAAVAVGVKTVGAARSAANKSLGDASSEGNQ